MNNQEKKKDLVREESRIFDQVRLLLFPLLTFLFVAVVNPFGIPDATEHLSEVTADRIRAPYYNSVNEAASVVILIDDAALLEAGERWPLPALQWQRFLGQLHFHEPGALFLDLMIADLREFPDLISGSNVSEQRCLPCAGGHENPINALTCYFRPAVVDGLAPSPEAVGSGNWACKAPVSQNKKTYFIAAGANPQISERALWAQDLPRCERPIQEDVQRLEARQGSVTDPIRAHETVLPCLSNAALIAPIQWRARDGEYPLIVKTGSADHVLASDEGPTPFEPSVALSMLAAYCDRLAARPEVVQSGSEAAIGAAPKAERAELPPGCQDYLFGDLNFQGLLDRAARGDNNHHLVIDWKARPPETNYERDIVGCEARNSNDATRFWQAIELFFSAFFSSVSERSAERLNETCPPVQTIIADLRPLAATNGADFKELLPGAAVFIGSNIGIAPDRHETPIHQTLPGVYLHAMAFDNLLSEGSQYSHPAKSYFDLSPSPNWTSPFAQQTVRQPLIFFVEAVSALAMGVLAVWQYRSRLRSPQFPEIEEELRYFLIALLLVLAMIAAPIILRAIDSGPISGSVVDWVLLLGVAVAAFPSGPRTIALRTAGWLFVRPEDELHPLGYSRHHWTSLVVLKLVILFAPLFLLFHPRMEFEIAHISICLFLGVFVLICWAMSEKLWKSVLKLLTAVG